MTARYSIAEIPADVGNWIKTQRESLGWSQTELSRRMQARGFSTIHPTTVTRMEGNQRRLTLDEAQALLSILGLRFTSKQEQNVVRLQREEDREVARIRDKYARLKAEVLGVEP